MASTSPSSESLRLHKRRLPVGAEVIQEGGVHFRVWAPKHKSVSIVLNPGSESETSHSLAAEHEGYFAGHVERATAGMLYGFRLTNDEKLFPDPASRYQPQGAHGPSQIVDPSRFVWHDDYWPGIELHGQ
jgi:maltooligosyltrehalose trehalohydrolase